MGGALASLGYSAAPATPSASASASGGGALASLGYAPSSAGAVARPAGTTDFASAAPDIPPAPTMGSTATPQRGFWGTVGHDLGAVGHAITSPIASGIGGLFNGLQRVGNAPLEAQRQGLAAMGQAPITAPAPGQSYHGTAGTDLGNYVQGLQSGAVQGPTRAGIGHALSGIGSGLWNLTKLVGSVGGAGSWAIPGGSQANPAFWHGLAQGLTEPLAQAPTGADVFAQASGGQAPRAADVLLGGADAIAGNAASYIPISDVARAARIPQSAALLRGLAGKGVAKAAAASPAVGAAVNALRMGAGAVGQAFDRLHGFTPTDRGIVSAMEGKNMADEAQRQALFERVLSGVSPETKETLANAIERAPGYEHLLPGSELEKVATRAQHYGTTIPEDLAQGIAIHGALPTELDQNITALRTNIGTRINESLQEAQQAEEQAQNLMDRAQTEKDPVKANDLRFDATQAQDTADAARERINTLRDLLPRLSAPLDRLSEVQPGQDAELTKIAEPLQAQQRADTKDLLDRGLIGSVRLGYVPHILSDRFENPDAIYAANRSAPMRASTPHGKARTVEGTIAEINAGGGDTQFENDAHKAMLAGMISGRRAVNLHDMLQALTENRAQTMHPRRVLGYLDQNPNGVVKMTGNDAKTIERHLPATHKIYQPKTLQMYRALMADPRMADFGEIAPEDLHEGIGVSGNAPAYIVPRAHANFLNNVTEPRRIATEEAKVLGRALDSVRNLQLRGQLANPTVHFWHNVIPLAGMVDPGAIPEYAKYLDEVRGAPAPNSMYERAMKAGAISHVAPSGIERGIAGRVNASARLAEAGGKRPALEAASHFLHNLTFDRERAMRVALFSRALDRGMKDAAAAAFVNRTLGNARDLSPFERLLQRGAFPFYSYEKAMLGTVGRTALQNTPRYSIPLQVENAVNVATSGHNQAANPPGKMTDLEYYGPDGKEHFIGLYNPLTEFEKVGTEGPGAYAGARLGALPFGLAAKEITGLSNPLATPASNYPIVQYPELLPRNNPQATPETARANDVHAFGSWGPRIAPRLQLILDAFASPARYGGVTGGGSTAQVLAQLLGNNASTRSAGSDQRTAKYHASQFKSQLRSARKAGRL